MNARRVATLVVVALLAGAASAGAQGAPAAKARKTTAPSVDSVIVAQERALFDAVTRNDYAALNRTLGSDIVYVDRNGAMQWERSKTAELLKGCTTGQWAIDNPKATRVGTDLVILTYTASGEQTCGGQQTPSPIYAMSVWQKRGGRWVGVAHSETPAAPKQ